MPRKRERKVQWGVCWETRDLLRGGPWEYRQVVKSEEEAREWYDRLTNRKFATAITDVRKVKLMKRVITDTGWMEQ